MKINYTTKQIDGKIGLEYTATHVFKHKGEENEAICAVHNYEARLPEDYMDEFQSLAIRKISEDVRRFKDES